MRCATVHPRSPRPTATRRIPGTGNAAPSCAAPQGWRALRGRTGGIATARDRPGRRTKSIDGNEDPAERLNRLFAEQSSGASDRQRESVLKWQGKDERSYRDIQLAAAGMAGAPQWAKGIVDDLDALMALLPEQVQVWRGVRNSGAAFQVPSGHLEELIGVPQEIDRFFATSLDRVVALDEFAEPGSDPVVYKIAARADTPALWVPPLGSGDDAYQKELLFPRGVIVRIVRVDRSQGVPIVEVEARDG